MILRIQIEVLLIRDLLLSLVSYVDFEKFLLGKS